MVTSIYVGHFWSMTSWAIIILYDSPALMPTIFEVRIKKWLSWVRSRFGQNFSQDASNKPLVRGFVPHAQNCGESSGCAGCFSSVNLWRWLLISNTFVSTTSVLWIIHLLDSTLTYSSCTGTEKNFGADQFWVIVCLFMSNSWRDVAENIRADFAILARIWG